MSEQPAACRIRVEALAEAFADPARQWAERLGLPLQDADAEFALQFGEQGLQLQQLGPDAPGPVRVDFVEGGAAHRRLYGGGSGQMIAKAVGVAQGVRPRVLDATAGLGKDAFVLASLGCQMSLIERQPLIGALLEDGLLRAAADFEVAPIVARMQLLKGNSIELMRNWQGEPPQVIYLDPMFPHREKTALVKKKCACSGPWLATTPMPQRCLRRPWPWPATGWWSSGRARRPASRGPSPATRWTASPAATTSIRKKRSRPDGRRVGPCRSCLQGPTCQGVISQAGSGR